MRLTTDHLLADCITLNRSSLRSPTLSIMSPQIALLAFAITAAGVLILMLTQAMRWKDPKPLQLLGIVLLIQIGAPIVGDARVIAMGGHWSSGFGFMSAANVGWLTASAFDPLGPFMPKPGNSSPYGPDRYWSLNSRRRPPVIFWPIATVIFLVGSQFV